MKSLELIDFQCNGLSDKHGHALLEMITTQYALKDVLRWKLSLRTKEDLNIKKLGIKCFNLSRNELGDDFAIDVS